MNAPLHTPPPWRVVPYGDHGQSLVIHDRGDNRICFMATPGAEWGARSRIRANAQLISFAPELLAYARIGLASLERELAGRLETACRLDDDLEPLRHTLPEEDRDYVEGLEAQIDDLKAKLAQIEQVPA